MPSPLISPLAHPVLCRYDLYDADDSATARVLLPFKEEGSVTVGNYTTTPGSPFRFTLSSSGQGLTGAAAFYAQMNTMHTYLVSEHTERPSCHPRTKTTYSSWHSSTEITLKPPPDGTEAPGPALTTDQSPTFDLASRDILLSASLGVPCSCTALAAGHRHGRLLSCSS